jgi:hypothetical protein
MIVGEGGRDNGREDVAGDCGCVGGSCGPELIPAWGVLVYKLFYP